MQNCKGKDNHLDRWKRMLDLLEAHGALPFVIIDLSIVRGLAYYTGFVHEAFEASVKVVELSLEAEDTITC